MVRIVVGIVTVVFAGIGSELVAQEGESHVAKEVVAAPEPKDALSLRIELLSDARQCTGRFARFSDVHLLMMMQNRGTAPLLLAVDEAPRRWISTPTCARASWRCDGDDGAACVPRSSGTFSATTRFEARLRRSDPLVPRADTSAGRSRCSASGESPDPRLGSPLRATYRGPPDLHRWTRRAGQGPWVASCLLDAALQLTDPTRRDWSEPQDGLASRDPRPARRPVSSADDRALRRCSEPPTRCSPRARGDYSQDDALRDHAGRRHQLYGERRHDD